MLMNKNRSDYRKLIEYMYIKSQKSWLPPGTTRVARGRTRRNRGRPASESLPSRSLVRCAQPTLNADPGGVHRFHRTVRVLLERAFWAAASLLRIGGPWTPAAPSLLRAFVAAALPAAAAGRVPFVFRRVFPRSSYRVVAPVAAYARILMYRGPGAHKAAFA